MVGEIEKFIRNLSLIDYKMYIENKVLQFQSFLNLLYCAWNFVSMPIKVL